jgi:hypothetical protein
LGLTWRNRVGGSDDFSLAYALPAPPTRPSGPLSPLGARGTADYASKPGREFERVKVLTP